MKMLEKLNKAKPVELQLWMLSAGIIGLGFGIYFVTYINKYALLILLFGILIHLITMYKIYWR